MAPQHANKCLLKGLESRPLPVFTLVLAPDRDVDRWPEPRGRDPAGRRAHQVHGLRRAQVAAERADRHALVLPLHQGDVPARVYPAAGPVDEGELAAAQLLGDQVLDRGRHAGPVGRGRPGGGLVGEHPDLVLGNAQAGQHLAGLAPGVGAGGVDVPQPLARVAPQPGLARGHDDEAVPEDRLGHQGQGRVVGNGGPDGDVREPVGHQDAHLAARRHACRDLDRTGEALGERLRQRADHELGDGGRGDHPQLFGRALCRAHGGVRLGAQHHDLRGGGEQPGPSRGQRHADRTAGDQLIAQVHAQRR